jgi:PHD/YefM family antitoxin component YafN of YafNO toxin-antitoxin module
MRIAILQILDKAVYVLYNVHIGRGGVMSNINATFARQNFFRLLKSAIECDEPVSINTAKGNAVLISEEEYNGLKETAYLHSVPGMKKKILHAAKEPLSKCKRISPDEL